LVAEIQVILVKQHLVGAGEEPSPQRNLLNSGGDMFLVATVFFFGFGSPF
jgi:hypothetical protein